MPKYKLLLHGRNRYAKINGSIEKVGFYTTLIVEAETSSEAQIKARQILEEDHRVKDLMTPGGFQMQGTARKVKGGRTECLRVDFDIVYRWNDRMDPNFGFSTDSAKFRL